MKGSPSNAKHQMIRAKIWLLGLGMIMQFTSCSPDVDGMRPQISRREVRMDNWRILKDSVVPNAGSLQSLLMIVRKINSIADSILPNFAPFDSTDEIATHLEFHFARFDSLVTGYWSVDHFFGGGIRRDILGLNYWLSNARVIDIEEIGIEALDPSLVRSLLNKYPGLTSFTVNLEDVRGRFVIEDSTLRVFVPLAGETFEEVVLPLRSELSN
jgi:hypothetical protein